MVLLFLVEKQQPLVTMSAPCLVLSAAQFSSRKNSRATDVWKRGCGGQVRSVQDVGGDAGQRCA
eukprot:1772738-Rhodomonas_salina.1